MKTEKIKLIVTMTINYENALGRKEAIRNAKRCTLNTSILGMSGCKPTSAVYLKPKISQSNEKD